MTRNQQIKQELVNEIVDKLKRAKTVVLVDYRGLTVEQDTDLRRSMRAANVDYKVYKNTLVERALKQEGMDEGLIAHLAGPTAFAFSYDDHVAPAKQLVDFIKKAKKMTLKAGMIDGRMVDAASVEALAEMPPREVLLAKMLGSMNAPITGLVTVLGGTLRSLLYTLNAIKDSKEN